MLSRKDTSFDWRGFLFLCKALVLIFLMGVSARYGTLYAAGALWPSEPPAPAPVVVEPMPLQNVVKRTSEVAADTETQAQEEQAMPELSASAALSVLVDSSGTSRVLLSKQADQELPIASMTKLMTALVVNDLFDPTDTVTVSQNTLNQTGNGLSGLYHAGDTFFVTDALYAMLVASHNEIANAFAEKAGVADFVQQMNAKAAALGMQHTHFTNPSGLDPTDGEAPNYSTASDVYALLRYVYEKEPKLFAILGTKEYRLKDVGASGVATVHNTDQLLHDNTIGLPVVGGKTGQTGLAGKNLAVVSSGPLGDVIISVVIGSQDNFSDMRGVLQYVASTSLPSLWWK